MAEGFEPYHVPQQSRRDKLRVLAGQAHPVCLQPGSPSPPPSHLHHALLPLSYDPTTSFISSSSDLLMCAEPAVKEEGSHHHVINHLMGFASNSTSSSTFRHNNHHPYMDPQFPLTLTAVQEINANPFLCPPQNVHPLRDFDHQQPPYDDQVVVFKPEPLSLSLSSSQPTNHTHHTQQTQNNTNNNSLQRFSSPGINYDSINSGVSVASVPFGPFTGYASILKGSRFLKPAQQLLEEFCDVSSREIYSAKVLTAEDSSSFLDPPIESFGDDDSLTAGGDGGQSTRKKSRLISMLDEVFGLL